MSSKKHKVDSECHIFKDEWTWKYFYTVFRDKPLCLICNKTVAVYKEYNISRHFNSKHKVEAMVWNHICEVAHDIPEPMEWSTEVEPMDWSSFDFEMEWK